MKNKKVLIGVIAIVAVIAVIAAAIAVGSMNKNSGNQNAVSTSAPEAGSTTVPVKESKEVMTEKPVLMYFVSASDERHDETMKILDELKSEYADKVTFNITDIDEKPEAVEQYSLNILNSTGKATPTLIMLNTKGDFVDIKGGFADKDTLKGSIEKALK